MFVRSFVAVAALAILPHAAKSQDRHGVLYELQSQLQQIENNFQRRARSAAIASRSRSRALGQQPPEAPAPVEPLLDSFFVNIFDPSQAVPLNAKRREALGTAIANVSNDRPNEPNQEIPAGFTFLGQFVDHDITKNEIEIQKALVVSANVLLASAASIDVYRSEAREIAKNGRSALLDLDSVYGGLTFADFEALFVRVDDRPICPERTGDAPEDCYQPTADDRLAISVLELDSNRKLTGKFEVSFRANSKDGPITVDLPRCGDKPRFALAPPCEPKDEQGETVVDITHRAVIGDPRNDENLVIAQIHLVFLLAHNKLLDQKLAAIGDTISLDDRIKAIGETRRTLVDHWQAIVLDDYLTEHVGRAKADALRTGAYVFYTSGDGQPFCKAQPGAMPHEFAVGAFRHGHSQVRAGYRLNQRNGAGFLQMFGDKALFADRALDFRLFFNSVNKFDPNSDDSLTPAQSMAIDTILSPPLAMLMAPSIPKSDLGHPTRSNLAKRNLARAGDTSSPDFLTVRLLSGLQVAQAIQARGATIALLSDAEVAASALGKAPAVATAFPQGLKASDLPLWVYVLLEAELKQSGRQLGDVGGIIIGETLAGLIRCDEQGILEGARATTAFVPSLYAQSGAIETSRYLFADLVNFAFE